MKKARADIQLLETATFMDGYETQISHFISAEVVKTYAKEAGYENVDEFLKNYTSEDTSQILDLEYHAKENSK